MVVVHFNSSDFLKDTMKCYSKLIRICWIKLALLSGQRLLRLVLTMAIQTWKQLRNRHMCWHRMWGQLAHIHFNIYWGWANIYEYVWGCVNSTSIIKNNKTIVRHLKLETVRKYTIYNFLLTRLYKKKSQRSFSCH